ncbi:hypothetical protein HYC85_008412 [Camellia sinensis]|uniref:Uncharacterized protein n=1 Tax=Camellia sinensis TaxID=4442 RepID=A0A7J7HU18_CAMSI|nr:hypothetical protein HYC85_008412 [Camellia sinensis]
MVSTTVTPSRNYSTGKHSQNLLGTLYVKLNVCKKCGVFSSNAVPVKEMKLNCLSLSKNTIQLDRVYKPTDGNKFLNFLVWFGLPAQ